MNDRKVRKYKAAKAAAKGVDYYTRPNLGVGARAKRTAKILRQRKAWDKHREQVLPVVTKSTTRAYGKLQLQQQRAGKVFHPIK